MAVYSLQHDLLILQQQQRQNRPPTQTRHGRVKWGASACLHLEWVSASVLVQHLLPSNNCVTNLHDRKNSIYLNEPVSQHSLLTTRWVCCLGHLPNVRRVYCMPLQGIRQVESESDTIG